MIKKQTRLARRHKSISDLIAVDKSLTTEQASIYLSLSPRTLEAYRCKGGGPAYEKLGRSVRYPADELIAWRNARRKNATCEY